MDWKTFAIEKLKDYEAKRQALENIPLQIAEIESTMSGIRSARVDEVPSRGEGSKYEDRLLSLIVQKDELQRCLERARLWVSIVDHAMAVLDQDERKVLDRLYIAGDRGAVGKLADECFVDVRTIHRWKDKALRRFTIALYGGTES